MSILDSVIKESPPRPRRTLVYGPEGIGKSTFAAAWPQSLVIQTEDGLADIACARLPLAKSWADVEAAFLALCKEPHEFKAIVIDSIDWLERLIWVEVCKAHKVDSIDEIGFFRGYTFALAWWARVIKALDYLRQERGCEAVLVAHSKIEKVPLPGLDPFERFEPKINKHAQHLLIEWCDEVLFARWEIQTRKTEEGFGKARIRAIGGTDRVLCCHPTAAWIAKTRLRHLPAAMELDTTAYLAARRLP